MRSRIGKPGVAALCGSRAAGTRRCKLLDLHHVLWPGLAQKWSFKLTRDLNVLSGNSVGDSLILSFLSRDGIMRSNLFWLTNEQWDKIHPLLPTDVRGKKRVDDRRVISGILHVLKSGCRWCDCPPEYGPPTTIYNRFVRWARRGVWEKLFRELSARGRSDETQMVDSTHIKAHRSASGGKGGSRNKRLDVRAAGAIQKYMRSRILRAAFFPSC